MTTAARYRELERIFAGGPYNQAWRPELSVSAGQAVVSLAVRPEMFHAGGVAHGSVAFRLLDDAATFAALSMLREETTLTSSFTLYFLRPISGGVITATGRVIQVGRRLILAESEAVDENGRAVARGSGTFMRSAA